MHQQYVISDDPAQLDFEVLYDFIAHSYWGKGMSRDTVKRSLDNSLCFGVYSADGQQVGFASVVTDKATFAWLRNVFILPDHRGKGLSKQLTQAVLDHPDLQNLRRFMLATDDAHGLYEQFGFKPLQNADNLMVR